MGGDWEAARWLGDSRLTPVSQTVEKLIWKVEWSLEDGMRLGSWEVTWRLGVEPEAGRSLDALNNC